MNVPFFALLAASMFACAQAASAGECLHELDTDNSGALSQEELFKSIDVDGDGKVSADELASFMDKDDWLDDPANMGLLAVLFLLCAWAVQIRRGTTAARAANRAAVKSNDGKVARANLLFNFVNSGKESFSSGKLMLRLFKSFDTVLTEGGVPGKEGKEEKELIEAAKSPEKKAEEKAQENLDRLFIEFLYAEHTGTIAKPNEGQGQDARDYAVKLFGKIDTDEDKKVTRKEWIAYFATPPKPIEEASCWLQLSIAAAIVGLLVVG